MLLATHPRTHIPSLSLSLSLFLSFDFLKWELCLPTPNLCFAGWCTPRHWVHKHMHSISNSPLTLLCKVLATTFRQDYVFVIVKPIQTKIRVCFDPIIYPPGSHQLAGRLVCLAHGFLVCPIRSSYMSCQRWQRSVQLSSIETQSEPL